MNSDWFRVPETDDTDTNGGPQRAPKHYDQVERYWGIPQPVAGNRGESVWFVRYFASPPQLRDIRQDSDARILTSSEIMNVVSNHLGREITRDELDVVTDSEVIEDA